MASHDAPVKRGADDSVQPAEAEQSAQAGVPRLAGRAPRLGILMIASEVAPWAKTGVLADVTGSLPVALDRLGHRVTLVMPRYRASETAGATVSSRTIRLGTAVHDVTFHIRSLSPRRRLVMVDVPRLFNREGYYGTGGRDFDDNAERFGVLAVAALEFAEHDISEASWDIVHAHDWQAGLAPTLLSVDAARFPRLREAGSVLTIHNLAYQGLFPREVVPGFGLPWNVFTRAP